MFSTRFDRPVIVTRHARDRMAERNVDDELLLQLMKERRGQVSSIATSTAVALGQNVHHSITDQVIDRAEETPEDGSQHQVRRHGVGCVKMLGKKRDLTPL